MAVPVALVDRLREVCGDEHVITQKHQLATYESDGLLHYAVTPGAVVLPGDASSSASAACGACSRSTWPTAGWWSSRA